METDTQTKGCASCAGHDPRDRRDHGHLPATLQLVTLHNGMGARLAVTLAELQAIVQAAYDQHGILAAPSYTTEAELAEGRRYCQCGQAGCSDPDPKLVTFSQAWARSIGDAQ